MRTVHILSSSFVVALAASACGFQQTSGVPSVDRGGDDGVETGGDSRTTGRSPRRTGSGRHCRPTRTSGGSEATTGGNETTGAGGSETTGAGGNQAGGAGGGGGQGGAGEGGSCDSTTSAGAGGGDAGAGGGDTGPAAGDVLWSNGYAVINGADYMFDGPWNVAANAAGNVYVSVYVGDGIDFGGGPLMNPQEKIDAGAGGFFLAKLDAQGQHVWSKQGYGGTQMRVSAAGDIYLGWTTYDFGAYGAGVLELDTNGDLVGTAKVDGQGLSDFALDASGSLVIVGPHPTDQSTVVARLDATGGLVWQQAIAGVTAASVAVSAAGDRIVIGGQGEGAMWVTALDGSGALQWSSKYGSDGAVLGIGLDASGRIGVLASSFAGDFGAGAPPPPLPPASCPGCPVFPAGWVGSPGTELEFAL